MKTFRKSFIKTKLLKETSAKETLRESFIKAQSAMEYLMTYGWAILIIAVVLGALFELGVFNANNFAPKAPPGACQVFRPNGPGTTSFINLEGICTGEIPQYVASFDGSSTIQVTSAPQVPIGDAPRTVTLWFFVPVLEPYNGVFGYGTASDGAAYTIFVDSAYGGTVCFDLWDSNQQCSGGNNLHVGVWEFAAGTYNSSTSILTGYTGYGGQLNSFIAGNVLSADTVAVSPTYPILIGDRTSTAGMAGMISNVQIYNTSLSANEIQALYLEGIGGAPIDLQHLVGWWPLNGNANDYSGNGNNGQINNVNFVSNWWSGYTPL